MRKTYKIILRPVGRGAYTVLVPDFDSRTQGRNVTEAVYAAKDLIGTTCIELQDMGKDIPVSGSAAYTLEKHDTVMYVGVDLAAYRRKNDSKAENK